MHNKLSLTTGVNFDTLYNMLTVIFFQTGSGNEPVRDWLRNLTPIEKKIIGGDIRAVQRDWPIGPPLVKKVDSQLKEIRTRLPDKIARILFIIEDDTVYLLHGFIKKSVKIPKEDLETAHSRLKVLRSQDKD